MPTPDQQPVDPAAAERLREWFKKCDFPVRKFEDRVLLPFQPDEPKPEQK